MSARSHEHERLAAASLCSRRDPIILERLFELVLNIVRIVDELHEHGVVAGAAATGESRIILRMPRIVDELLIIADAAATGEGRIVRPASEGGIVLPRIVGELLVIADAAAAGEGWIVRPAGEGRIVLARIVGVGGDNAAQRLTFGDVELVARTYDDCPRAKLAGS